MRDKVHSLEILRAPGYQDVQRDVQDKLGDRVSDRLWLRGSGRSSIDDGTHSKFVTQTLSNRLTHHELFG